MANPLLLLGDSKPLPAPPLRPTDQKIVSATVSRIDGDAVYVTVQEFSGTYNFGPLETPEGWAPEVGDACLVAFDQNNVGHVVPGWQGAAALEAEIALLQGKVSALEVPTVEALPGSPSEGEEVFFQNAAMAAQGVRWRLVYNGKSASTYKWELVGGPALGSPYSGSLTLATSEVFTAIPSGPELVVPLEGEYQFGLTCRIESTEAATRTMRAVIAVNGTNVGKYLELVGSTIFMGGTLGQLTWASGVLGAGAKLTVQAWQTGTQTGIFTTARISLQLIRGV